MKKDMNVRRIDTLLFVAKNPGCTQKDVLLAVYKSVKDTNYGRQSPASTAIARLRKDGLIEDDCDRCPHCGRASRGRRNVTLSLTDKGRKFAAKVRRNTKKVA